MTQRLQQQALDFLNEQVCWKCTDLKSVDQLTTCVKTAIASKQLGCEGPLAKLVAEACAQVMPPVPSKFDVDNVRVTKVQGGNLNSSFVVEGMAIARRTSGVEQFKEKAKAGRAAEQQRTQSHPKPKAQGLLPCSLRPARWLCMPKHSTLAPLRRRAPSCWKVQSNS